LKCAGYRPDLMAIKMQTIAPLARKRSNCGEQA
jgi:hypothetical protein